jgi:hypothetical protein
MVTADRKTSQASRQKMSKKQALASLVQSVNHRHKKIAGYDKAVNVVFAKFSNPSNVYTEASVRNIAANLKKIRAEVNHSRRKALETLGYCTAHDLPTARAISQVEDLGAIQSKIAGLLTIAHTSIGDQSPDQFMELDSNGYVHSAEDVPPSDDSNAPTFPQDENMTMAGEEEEAPPAAPSEELTTFEPPPVEDSPQASNPKASNPQASNPKASNPKASNPKASNPKASHPQARRAEQFSDPYEEQVDQLRGSRRADEQTDPQYYDSSPTPNNGEIPAAHKSGLARLRRAIVNGDPNDNPGIEPPGNGGEVGNDGVTFDYTSEYEMVPEEIESPEEAVTAQLRARRGPVAECDPEEQDFVDQLDLAGAAIDETIQDEILSEDPLDVEQGAVSQQRVQASAAVRQTQMRNTRLATASSINPRHSEDLLLTHMMQELMS